MSKKVSYRKSFLDTNGRNDMLASSQSMAYELEQQLEKANEAIVSLNAVLKSEFDKREALDDELAKTNERVKELEELKNSLAYSEETGFIDLNKFAIEKKIEGACAVISLLDPTKDSKAILMANKYVREQLRKEQE